MTYKIVKNVHADFEDYETDVEETLKEGFKSIKAAESYMNRVYDSMKYKDKLAKLFEKSRAIRVKEFYEILDENDNKVNECYWHREIYKEKKGREEL